MLQVMPLNSEDYDLITAAEKIIEKNYKYGRHPIGSAVRTKTGNIFAAVPVEANVGRITVCGEAMAIGKSISEDDHEFDTIVAVAHPHPHENIEKCWVVAPCGMRELISDYGKNTNVILSYNGELVKCNVMELLLEKYTSEVE
ncbi:MULTISPECIES: cytidine deaminase [unclassified Bacillus cereus group]|uniref:cytidine deaminase n=1 Tax=unclassified Bacillus cereus group TaxID=2750818 RepID=UPI0022E03933|nr:MULTISPECIES: cytidine deaminase [unclassified Bacillus cereus group]MDA1652385.1 cytidine deaminase [Bacillus cereus group sp. TH160LC]MDA1802240.1 cytidine deaminase [Bacillus cereus group sp. BY6-1LC]